MSSGAPSKFAQSVTVDLRSLALLRAGAALLVLVDLCSRAVDLTVFYTDVGVLSRTRAIQWAGLPWTWSLHLLSGSLLFQAALFLLAGLAALALLVGWHTRVAAFVTWLLFVSLGERNPIILDGGDAVLGVLLFWALLLPLDARWSVDRALGRVEPLPSGHRSIAAAGLTFQVFAIFFFSGVQKLNEWWLGGKAVWIAFNLDQLALPLALLLRQSTALCEVLTYSALALELLGPLGLFLPFLQGPGRVLVVALMVSLVTGMGLCFELSLFPLANIIGWLALLPPGAWDALLERLARSPVRGGIRLEHDAVAGLPAGLAIFHELFLLPQVPLSPASGLASSWELIDGAGARHSGVGAIGLLLRASPLLSPFVWLWERTRGSSLGLGLTRALGSTGPVRPAGAPARAPGRASQAFAAVALVAIIASNCGQAAPRLESIQAPFQPFYEGLHLGQYWTMFSGPSAYDGWFVSVGERQDGVRIDPLNERDAVTFERPEPVYKTYKNRRWRKYLQSASFPNGGFLRRPLLNYLCGTWNDAHPDGQRLARIELFYMLERTRPEDYTIEAPRKLLLGARRCPGVGMPAPAEDETPRPDEEISEMPVLDSCDLCKPSRWINAR